jgi:hypothetical protein
VIRGNQGGFRAGSSPEIAMSLMQLRRSGRVRAGSRPYRLIPARSRASTGTGKRALTRPAFSFLWESVAAARDPGLVWDARTRSYRLRAEASPAPPLATGNAVEGEGQGKVLSTPQSRPAPAKEENANMGFPVRARARARGAATGWQLYEGIRQVPFPQKRLTKAIWFVFGVP